ncbi:(2Fe-2S)-binding protein [Bdellovibrionota bacterium FG-2]
MTEQNKPTQFTLNGDRTEVCAPSMTRLLDVLREQLHLTGTKEGCGEGECGACCVLVDGDVVNSCLVPLAQVEGSEVRTIEGVVEDPRFKILQNEFVAHGGAQCGICTPGMIVSSAGLLEKNPHPNRDEIKSALAGNLCRCTGYTKIIDSVEAASK